MDNIQRLEQQANYIADNISLWELATITSIAKKIGKIGKLTDKEIEQFNIDEETEKEWKKIVYALSGAVLLNMQTLNQIYTDEINDWHKANKPLYDYRGIEFVSVDDNPDFKAIINSFSKQNAKDILNLTQTKALCVIDKNDNVVQLKDMIHKAFSEAVETVTTGKSDFYSAMRGTVQKLGGSGIRVDYGNGITRRLDTVTRQNMLWGVKQAHKEYNGLVGDQLNTDGIEIDYHSNSRPSHRFMQGKQYAKGEAKTINGVYYPSAEKEGVYARLYEDYNCYHYETDIILGVSEPRYSAEELRRFDERDKRIYKIGGIEKDGYGWSQTMRGLEADIRKSKDEINALSALGGNEAKMKELKNRIKTFQGKYDEISDITGIAKEKQRLTVPKSTEMRQFDLQAKPPKEFDGIFEDFEKLNLNKQEKQAFENLRLKTNSTGYEYGVIIENGNVGEMLTSKMPNAVQIPLENRGDGLTILHSHTNATTFSAVDFQKFVDKRVDKIGVIGYNNDVFMAQVGYGERPALEDFIETIKSIRRETDFEIMEHPNFFDWSIEERNYMAIREQAFKICRHYGWRIEGGRIDVK